ncbi:MAG: ornithine carbamoyltransferase [Pseudonocardiales bacterium]|nr:ornithine carbamoyltransferase [Pseudonocardiales bacterium]
MAPLPNTLFQRDNSAWVYGGVTINPMAKAARRRESLHSRAAYRFHPMFADATFPVYYGDDDLNHQPATLEGGDIHVLGRGVVGEPMITTLAPSRHPGSLLTVTDLGKDRFLGLVERAAQLKRAKATGREQPRLTGRTIALIFEKSSTRTRCAFEVAAYDQGAHVTYLGPEGSHIGKEESIPDTARVLGRMFDGIEFRGFAQETVEQLADHAEVPVWNGLTDSWHPTQMLADVLTMVEHRPSPPERITCCFLGDGRNNVARSLLGHRRDARHGGAHRRTPRAVATRRRRRDRP